ncbi:MAG: glycoside hydrolase family 88 protein [Clostridia bacterium]|nr:glycoside hydrolase family 88 protein [Clostridia bacterium]
MSVETMMRKFRAPDLPPAGRFHYHQGVFLSGVYENYLINGEEKYFEYIRQWVDSYISEDGELSGFDDKQLDDVQPGILLFPLYRLTGDIRYKKVLDKLCGVVWDFPRDPTGGLWHKHYYPYQMWLDGLYMGGPICAEYGKTFGRPEFLELTARQIHLMIQHTRDEKTGLLYHAWDYKKEQPWADRETGRSPEFWGRSIGWVCVAILNDLDFFPKEHPARPEMEREVVRLIKALIPYQGRDGRWYQVVDKPENPDNWPENSCSCLYTAAICKAVRLGILEEGNLAYARRGFEGVVNSLKRDGDDLLIGDVCVGTGVGDYTHYINRPTSVNDLHGVGAFLIMCAECARVF